VVEPQAEAKSIRRSFLKTLWTVLGLTALGEIFWVFFSFVKPERKKNNVSTAQTVNAGTTDTYKPGSVTAFVNGQFYLVCLGDGGFLAMSNKCTHLGCALTWDEEKKQFICPCHASVFDINGNVLSSPAPRALDLFSLKITNKQILVDTSQRLQRNRFNKSQSIHPESITITKGKDDSA
jgi:cytochrome b6-f complex iron-sulfur subunit